MDLGHAGERLRNPVEHGAVMLDVVELERLGDELAKRERGGD